MSASGIAVVGDQFGKNNWFRITNVYQIFYFSINLGSTFATLLAGLADLPIVTFFWVFVWLMLLAGVLFGLCADFYKMQTFTQ